MTEKLQINDQSMLYVLQLALEGALQNKEAARTQYENIAGSFQLSGEIDTGMAMAIKEISDSLEKYLKSGDNSVDKLIKIAKLLSDTMIKRDDANYEVTDEDKMDMQASLKEFIDQAKEEQENAS